MRRGGKGPELRVSAQEKPIVCEDAQERRMRRAGQSSSGRQHCLGISRKGLLAMQQPHGQPGAVAESWWGQLSPPVPPDSTPAHPHGLHPWPGDPGGVPFPTAVAIPIGLVSLRRSALVGFFKDTELSALVPRMLLCLATLPFPVFFCCGLVFFFGECSTPTFHPTLNRGGDGESNLL